MKENIKRNCDIENVYFQLLDFLHWKIIFLTNLLMIATWIQNVWTSSRKKKYSKVCRVKNKLLFELKSLNNLGIFYNTDSTAANLFLYFLPSYIFIVLLAVFLTEENIFL